MIPCHCYESILHMSTNANNRRTVLFILNYNGTKMTCDLLASLRKIEIPYPVWVVDNGSDHDDSIEFQTVLPSVVIKRIPHNCGFAGGVNRAMAMASAEDYDYAYEMNNDTLAKDDFLTPCVEIMERQPDVDVVGSRTLTLDRQTGNFSIWGFLSDPKWAGKFRDGFAATNRVVGCGMLLRVSSFRTFGGLDERFFLYMEESDYCFRLVRAGKKVGIAANSLILHQGKATNDGPSVRYYYARNCPLFAWLHATARMNGASSLLHDVIIRSIKDAIRGDSSGMSASGQGFWDAIRGKFGKRGRPFSAFFGCMAFVLLAPCFFVYSLAFILISRTNLLLRRIKHKKGHPEIRVPNSRK